MSGSYGTARRGSWSVYAADLIAEGLPLSAVSRMSGEPLPDVQEMALALRHATPRRPPPAPPKPREIPKAKIGRLCGLPPTASAIIAQIAARHGVTVEQMMAARGGALQVAMIRQEIFWELRRVKSEFGTPRYSYPQIGRWFRRDHTTIIWGCVKHAKRLAEAAMGIAAE